MVLCPDVVLLWYYGITNGSPATVLTNNNSFLNLAFFNVKPDIAQIKA